MASTTRSAACAARVRSAISSASLCIRSTRSAELATVHDAPAVRLQREEVRGRQPVRDQRPPSGEPDGSQAATMA